MYLLRYERIQSDTLSISVTDQILPSDASDRPLSRKTNGAASPVMGGDAADGVGRRAVRSALDGHDPGGLRHAADQSVAIGGKNRLRATPGLRI